MTLEKAKSDEMVVQHKNQTKSEIEFISKAKIKVIKEKSDEKTADYSGKKYNKNSEKTQSNISYGPTNDRMRRIAEK